MIKNEEREKNANPVLTLIISAFHSYASACDAIKNLITRLCLIVIIIVLLSPIFFNDDECSLSELVLFF